MFEYNFHLKDDRFRVKDVQRKIKSDNANFKKQIPFKLAKRYHFYMVELNKPMDDKKRENITCKKPVGGMEFNHENV